MWPQVLEYMRSYCPLTNVTRGPYPALLVCASRNDPRVQFDGIARWVQRVREQSSSGRPVLLSTRQGGHFGAGGRLGHLDESARHLAWLMLQVQGDAWLAREVLQRQ